MGNCQAIDAQTLLIQHPNGRTERWYWPVPAKEVMKTNPGHYVALIITLCVSEKEEKNENGGVRITRVKILRPTDMLVLGQAYRLITSEEVMKGLWAKKYKKMKKNELESKKKNELESKKKKESELIGEKAITVCEKQSSGCENEERTSESETNQVAKQEKHRHRMTSSASSRSKTWRPSLQSISEAGS